MTDNTDEVLFEIGGRQYTKEEAVTKIQNADQHIEKLETENSDFRQKVDDYMDVLSKLPTKVSAEPAEEPEKPSGISEEEVAELVKKSVTELTVKEAAEAKLRVVGQTLSDKFGGVEAGTKALADKAQELGLTAETVATLSAENPEVVLKWFDLKPVVSPSGGSSHNTQAVENANSGNSEGTYQWWAAMRKSDPQLYFSPKMTMKRMNDAERLGKEKFFGE